MSRFAIAAGMLFGSPPLLAGPAGGVVASGAASITQGANVTNINQSTQKAAINWQGFSVGAGETVNFNQPGASAVTLNRVIGNERSVIAGALNANGKVFLVNSNGVLFTRGSSVSTAGLVASTLNISDEDFQAGRYVFDKGAGAGGGVVNMGTLSAGEGGYVALLGQQVANEGVIVATRGNVALASGDRVVLNFNGDSMLSVSVDQGVLDALVESKGAIYADGGNVILTAKSAGELLDAQVNNSGIIRARTIGDLKGSIDIHAYGGTAAIDGTLDASAPAGGDGGFIETSGNKVRIAEGTVITTAAAAGKTGVWRVDPDGYTIANSGGDISATLLSSLLGSNNITLESTRGSGSGGDLNVNDALAWGGDTRLTLTATRDVNVNAAITATGEKAGLTLDAGEDINVNADVVLSGANAALAMNYGGDYHILTPATFSGAILDADGKPVANQAPEGTRYASITLSGENASLDINGDAYTLIHSMEQLDALDGYDAVLGTGKATAVSGRYAIAQDLDALGTTYVDALLGTSSNSAFSGTLTGLGHTISNLTSRGTAYSYAGLIGYATNVTLRDIGVVKANVETADLWYAGNQGILAGVVSTGSIYNAYTTGTIRGIGTGGLVGGLSNGTLSYAYSDADVFLPDDIPANQAGYGNREGGLAGSVSNAEVSHVHATGYSAAAGLIGSMTGSNVSYAYATGRAAGGGLIGTITTDANHPADVFVTNSFATGDVTGDASIYGGFYAGGLIGYIREPTNANMTYQVVIDNVYATGNVTLSLTKQYAASGVGGLIGAVDQAGSNSHGSISINNAHASGNVTYYGSYTYESDGIQYTSNGNGIVGGLVGDLWSNSSSITNSSATGDVSQVTGTAPTGGLVGRITSSLYSGGNVSTISGSYASGTVTAEGEGYARVGGLVGTDNARTQITSSYFSGRAWTNGTGPVDGIFNTSNGSIGSDVYFNSDNNSSTRGGQGLTSEQFADIAHYLDGTIDQVLSDRAAQAAAQAAAEAAAQAAAQAAAEAQAQAAAQAAAEAQAQAAAQAVAEAQAQAVAQAAAEAQAQAAAQAAAEAQAQAAAQATAQEAAAQQQAVESARLSGLSQARQVAHPGAIDGNIVLADNPSWQSGIQRLGVDGVSLELEKDVTQGK